MDNNSAQDGPAPDSNPRALAMFPGKGLATKNVRCGEATAGTGFVLLIAEGKGRKLARSNWGFTNAEKHASACAAHSNSTAGGLAGFQAGGSAQTENGRLHVDDGQDRLLPLPVCFGSDISHGLISTLAEVHTAWAYRACHARAQERARISSASAHMVFERLDTVHMTEGNNIKRSKTRKTSIKIPDAKSNEGIFRTSPRRAIVTHAVSTQCTVYGTRQRGKGARHADPSRSSFVPGPAWRAPPQPASCLWALVVVNTRPRWAMAHRHPSGSGPPPISGCRRTGAALFESFSALGRRFFCPASQGKIAAARPSSRPAGTPRQCTHENRQTLCTNFVPTLPDCCSLSPPDAEPESLFFDGESYLRCIDDAQGK
ncbi:hypothetical protein CH63R_10432 [Colletotrichum higginsianum IMI 349063]|uniref:Uncharacterized protein n=1 Tax=Colletotrichum higginsianum (strain IMI 349063) TaxID=759273 RepID=A0A1B7Y2S6_COLHI|nr:uncharacterized protein CH63R_10432 [Colletotrichum higginsianum IMI 349063]OBR06312.1 hypothetical protein CH63R_10432 [Colletotrichum higginsianum IMI 349063]